VPLLLMMPAKLFNLPLPANDQMWESRPQLEQALRSKLQRQRVAITANVAAIHGTAGVGKTSIATWLVHDMQVRLRFPDGVYWLTLGSEADVTAKTSELRTALADDSAPPAPCASAPLSSVPSASAPLSPVTCRRLVVLDDVWALSQVQPFEDLLSGSGATLLLTTRNSDLASDFAEGGSGGGVMQVEKMAEVQALTLLSNHLGRDVNADKDALALVRQCYCLPIAVRAVAAMVTKGNARVKKGSLNAALKYLQPHWLMRCQSMRC
jgi:hypothetical protein